MPCLRKAGGLIYDSYGRDGSQVHSDLRPWINDAWNTWERPAGNDIMDHPSGFHARFYRPKGSDLEVWRLVACLGKQERPV